MNKAPTYIPPYIKLPTDRGDHSLWEKAKAHYEKKEYSEAFEKLLEYCYGKNLPKKITDGKIEFTLPHNKTTVHISIEKGKYFITVPFIKLPATNTLGILRKIAEINFHPATLSQIMLHDQTCVIQYESFFEHCDPEKLYNLLEEMCFAFDFHTPIFQENFGATLVEERSTEKFNEEQINQAWDHYQKTLEEGLAYYHEFEKKHELYDCWDSLNIALKKIDFFLSPKGIIRSYIIQAVEEMQQKNTPLNQVLQKTLHHFEKLKNIQRAQFEESFYTSEKLFHYKPEHQKFFTKNYFDEVYKVAKEEQNKANHSGLTIYLTYTFYDFLYRNIAPQEAVTILQNALQNASGKTWKEASDILWKAMNDLREGHFTDKASTNQLNNPKNQQLYYALLGGLIGLGILLRALRIIHF